MVLRDNRKDKKNTEKHRKTQKATGTHGSPRKPTETHGITSGDTWIFSPPGKVKTEQYKNFARF
jgi:hypothetical protein